MGFIPLGDSVFLEIVEHEPDTELTDEFRELTEDSDLDLERERRRIEASISRKEPQAQQGTVFAMGPDCVELIEDDLVIFPLYSGLMVTIVDPITEEYKRVFVISEKNVLARYREG